jgi:hypothetical protein
MTRSLVIASLNPNFLSRYRAGRRYFCSLLVQAFRSVNCIIVNITYAAQIPRMELLILNASLSPTSKDACSLRTTALSDWPIRVSIKERHGTKLSPTPSSSIANRRLTNATDRV